jgi:hypothetical protein
VLPNVPLALLLHTTVPVGVLGVPASVSVTVAVQVDGAPTVAGLGEQATPTPTERVVAVSVPEPVLLR